MVGSSRSGFTAIAKCWTQLGARTDSAWKDDAFHVRHAVKPVTKERKKRQEEKEEKKKKRDLLTWEPERTVRGKMKKRAFHDCCSQAHFKMCDM